MEIELERTFLVKRLPDGLKKCKSAELMDIYLPRSASHPKLRIRKRGDKLEITKKSPIASDSSEQAEHTIALTEAEFSELSALAGKRVRKIRYQYHADGRMAEIDIFQDDLEGLVLADFEFASVEEKAKFKMPDWCLAEVTQEEFTAGGFLAGRKYSDIEPILKKFNYRKLR